MKNLDFLGTKPVFFINGETSSKTTFGGLLSVISALLILAASGYFIQMLFSRSSFNVLLSEDYNQNPTKSWNEPEFSVMLQNRLLEDIPTCSRHRSPRIKEPGISSGTSSTKVTRGSF